VSGCVTFHQVNSFIGCMLYLYCFYYWQYAFIFYFIPFVYFFLFIVLCVFLYFIITAALCVLINGWIYPESFIPLSAAILPYCCTVTNMTANKLTQVMQNNALLATTCCINSFHATITVIYHRTSQPIYLFVFFFLFCRKTFCNCFSSTSKIQDEFI